MNKKNVFLFCMAMIFLSSCTTIKSVDYTEANNYFHRNDAPLPNSLKITSQEEFNRQFGMAAFMGDKGKPTKIDFQKSFVIIKVLPVTDFQTTLAPVSLKKIRDKQLRLTYTLRQGKEQSFSTQPIFILVVDNKYKDFEIIEAPDK